MRIAVACDGLGIAPYYTQSRSYMCYTVTFGVVSSAANVPITEKIDNSVADLLKALEVDVLITGKIDPNHASELVANGIEVVSDETGLASEAVNTYLAKTFVPLDDWDDEDWD